MDTVDPYASPQSRVAEVQTDETGEIRVLSASGRLGRVRYIAYSIGFSMLAWMLVLALTALATLVSPQVGPIIAFLVGGMLYIALIVITFLLTIQRIHDFDTSGWLSLLMLVPLVNALFGILLWLIPGTPGKNRFGAKTPANSTGTVLLALVLPLVMVLGILAAIAIPAYNSYVEQARLHTQSQPVAPR